MPFSDIELSRRLERAEGAANAGYVEARARLFPEVGACWQDFGGTYAMFDGPGSPATQTFGLGLFGDATHDQLEAIEGFFTERGAPIFHEVSPMADPGILALLNERGYRPVELTSVLVQPLPAEPKPVAGNISCRVARLDEAQAWSDVSAAGWFELVEFADMIRDIAFVNFNKTDQLCVVAEIDGVMAATGAVSIEGGVAHLAGASTIPEYRKQGAQSALLDYRLRLSTERGCDLALMGALPGSASQRNAERNGFRIVYTRIKWGKNFEEPAK